MKVLLSVFLCLISATVFCQADSSKAAETDTAEKVFTVVQMEAHFPGGIVAWRRYLDKNLNEDLTDSCLAVQKGEKSIRQTVTLSFIVSKDGKVSDVRADNYKDIHPRLADEAIRVIKNGPDWIPAQQGGKDVTYRQKHYITFEKSNDP
jgi:periplasmic protein TonB